MKSDQLSGLVNAGSPQFSGMFGSMGCGCCGGTCTIKVCVSLCTTGSPAPGATVTVGTNPPVTCTTGANGCCSLSIGQSGTYSITVSYPGYSTYTGTQQFVCGQTYRFTLQTIGAYAVQFWAAGCGCNSLPGVLCTIGGQSCTTGANGQCSIAYLAPGTYTYTMSKARFQTYTGTVTITASCGSQTIYIPSSGSPACMQPAPGYAFAKNPTSTLCCYLDPVPTTLNLTDSAIGSCSMVYGANSKWPTLWYGTIPFNWQGYCGETGVPIPAYASYLWPGGLFNQCGIFVGITSDNGCPFVGGYIKKPTFPYTLYCDQGIIHSNPTVQFQFCYNMGFTGCNGGYPQGVFEQSSTIPCDVYTYIQGCGSFRYTYPFGGTYPKACLPQAGTSPKGFYRGTGCCIYGGPSGPSPILSLTE